ncbi:uncharacterized protein NFIA_005930 [Aspergillus fischeri NRRL 181]|uniref:Cytochrome P450 n=1 Tax=Neosartorya fischeri (strain ATCC 1020 / DSM 3700 / CBS 544.65 / FGSC A1164 / JCM 1740 / NRRL 181 / WB 181) TaxID=331117 RepID=A1DKJ0_NEOFI|nr:uncharacterized protein NFIA_005930 [Aspergillus fischeri NRRL 181]EAW17229.1 hypothetical protein NFIA_005930 [Aspergillus fischeri NRRL 181]KAG2004073.1 hypothetical protein GB937_009089 [Aspergillus fischeri]
MTTVHLGSKTWIFRTAKELYLRFSLSVAPSRTAGLQCQSPAELSAAMAALLFCYPEVFQKARAEVDRLCGTDKKKLRLPVLDDMDQMPYTCAIIKELLRWRPIFPSTPDHVLTSNLEFEGYHIPAGVWFVVNEIPGCYESEPRRLQARVVARRS